MGTDSESSGVTVNRAKVDSINIYEVTEHELELLESATPTGILFDVGVACLTTAISFIVTLSTTAIESNRLFYSFLIVVIIGILAGIISFIIWFVKRKSVKATVRKIKDRMKPQASRPETADSIG